MSKTNEIVDQMFAFPVVSNYDSVKLDSIRDAVKKENNQMLILDFVSLLMKIIGTLQPPSSSPKNGNGSFYASTFSSTSSLSKSSSFASLHSLLVRGSTGENSRSNSNNDISNSNNSSSNNTPSNGRSCSEDTSSSSNFEMSTNDTECTSPITLTAATNNNNIKNNAEPSANELNFVDDSIKRKKLVKEVIHWLSYLSARGFAEAQYLLADIYSSGLLLSKIENHRAFQLFLDAAKREHPESCYRVACCYEAGLGCNRDASKALKYLHIASSKSHPASLLKLSLYYFKGNLGISKTIQNQTKGLNLLKIAVQNATPITCNAPYELAKIYESGFSDILISDKQYALTLYKQAAKLGHGISCGFLGSIYELGDSPAYGIYKPDYKLSIYYYHLGAQQQDIISMMGISGWYLLGCAPILNKNEQKSFYWALMAAGKGLPKAQLTIAYFYRKGVGCEANKDESNRYALLAAANGYQKAKDYVVKNNISHSQLPRSNTSSSLMSEISTSSNNTKSHRHLARRKSLLSLSNFSTLSFNIHSNEGVAATRNHTRSTSIYSLPLTNIPTTTTTTATTATAATTTAENSEANACKNNIGNESPNNSSSKRISRLFRSGSLKRLRSGFKSFSARQ